MEQQHSFSNPQIQDERMLGLHLSHDRDLLPPDDDGIKKIVAQLHDLSLKTFLNGEVVDDDDHDDEEIKLKHALDEELYHLMVKQAIGEALQDESLKQAIYREIGDSEARDLRRFISEAMETNLEKKTETEVIDDDQIVNYESDRGEFENRSNGWDDYIQECGGYDLNHYGGEDSETTVEKIDTQVKDWDEYLKQCEGYEQQNTHNYPVRPAAEDCSFYMRTGTCKYESNCRFNHPLNRRNQGPQGSTMEVVRKREESSERPLQIECKYYSTSGCKYGNSCRYRHSKARHAAVAPAAVAPTLVFNFLGLPIRPGGQECSYYMQTGSCKYGSSCKFHHPDPTAAIESETQTPYKYNNNGGSHSLQNAPHTLPSWQSSRPTNETTPYNMYPPTQSLRPPARDWTSYQAPVYQSSETGLPTPPAFAMKMMPLEEYPERPGEPECTYFLKTGDCKYRSICRFHHPKNRVPKAPLSTLSDKGLPLRPDQSTCSHYSRYGLCKFGPACKYDHPTGYEPNEPSFGSGS
jgi:hypothetical protein